MAEGFELDTGYAAMAARSALKGHLAAMAVHNLAGRPLREFVVDYSRERKALRSGMVLALSLLLAERLRAELAADERRVGIVFPAGLGGMLTNLAVSLLGKVPVNFNFTAGRTATEAALELSGVQRVITAGPVRDKLGEFPWPERTHDLVAMLKGIDKKRILKAFASVTLSSAGRIIRQHKIPETGGHAEAGLLFSSGSTGRPKGIALSHFNVIGNIQQVQACHLLHDRQVLLACLPTFHSFGFTVTLWYPLVTGLKTVMAPSPLETKKLAEAIEREKVTVHIATPTFLRPFFQRAKPEQLASLKVVVGGAEKTPEGFAERWQSRFGSHYLEGYGLTETSPVLSVNLPAMEGHPAKMRAGSVGHVLEGMQARIVDPVSRTVLPRGHQGILEVKGVNVFSGYLEDRAATDSAFHDGWFFTHDLARFDDDNYLYIDGRISRFSKLGGEMVPHGQVEHVIAEAFDLLESEEPLVAVTGITDKVKGEALVLLTTVEIRPELLRQRMAERGIPNLWVPRIIQRVDAIPCLASGKLDLARMKTLAQAAR